MDIAVREVVDGIAKGDGAPVVDHVLELGSKLNVEVEPRATFGKNAACEIGKASAGIERRLQPLARIYHDALAQRQDRRAEHRAALGGERDTLVVVVFGLDQPVHGNRLHKEVAADGSEPAGWVDVLDSPEFLGTVLQIGRASCR